MSERDPFDALLAELDVAQSTMAKAQSAEPEDGDAKVQAAAEEAGATMPEGDEESGETEAGEGKEDEGEAPMGKSFEVTLEDGSKREAYDGTELLKSFSDRVDALHTEATARAAELEATKGDLAKALDAGTKLLGLIRSQGDVVKQQGELIKSLQTKVEQIGNTGRGRTAAVSIHEKTAAAPAPAAAPDGGDLLAKAMTLQATGKLSAIEIAKVEAALGSGREIHPQILALISAA